MIVAALLIPLVLIIALFAGGPSQTQEQLAPKENYTEQISGLHFAHIHPDCFLMGDKFDHGDQDEKPVHRVCLDKYGLSFTEVTVGQFREFVESTGYRTTAETLGFCYERNGQGAMVQRQGMNWRNPGFDQSDKHPVVCVSAEDAQAYAVWLSGQSEKVFRLPTEAEWEYAAHGGALLLEYGTKDGNIGPDLANYAGKEGFDSFAHTSPVGHFPPNPLGLYDMSGNVYEWVQDSMTPYSEECLKNPVKCGNAERVKRGGSFAVASHFLRASNRGTQPTAANDLGFRLVVEKP